MAMADLAWRENLFADLLRSLRLRSTVYFRCELHAPWGFRIADRGPGFHIVTQGKCWLEVDGLREPVRLSTGDFVLLPRGRAHVMRDALTSQHPNIVDCFKQNLPDNNGVFRVGGQGPITRLVCGGLQFENGDAERLLAALAPVIHVKGNGQGIPRWLRGTIGLLHAELDSRRPGAETVITRLSDILVVQGVRAHFEENAERADTGWLAALRDRHIGPALELLRSELHKPWTVATLARCVSLSRSALATKFAELVGEPPLHYLTRLRVNAAADRLRGTDEKLSAIGSSVGYKSLSALLRAFKKHFGVRPSLYRRAHGPDSPAYRAEQVFRVSQRLVALAAANGGFSQTCAQRATRRARASDRSAGRARRPRGK